MPTNILASAFTSDPGMPAAMTNLLGGSCYELLGRRITNVHPIWYSHDNAPFVPLAFFSFSHSDYLELTMCANPHSISISGQCGVDTISHKICHTVLDKFIELTET